MTSPIMMTSTMILEIVLREEILFGYLVLLTDLAYWQILILEGACFLNPQSQVSTSSESNRWGGHWVAIQIPETKQAINKHLNWRSHFWRPF
jgi:hypothetical protein